MRAKASWPWKAETSSKSTVVAAVGALSNRAALRLRTSDLLGRVGQRILRKSSWIDELSSTMRMRWLGCIIGGNGERVNSPRYQWVLTRWVGSRLPGAQLAIPT